MDNEEDKKRFLNLKYRSNCKKCCFQKQKEFKIELTSNQNIHKRKCNQCENILDNEMFYKNKDENFFYNCKNCHNIINNLQNVKQCIDCKEIFEKGSLVVFPSWLWHRVTPVTKGIRYSAVIWTLGKPFK